MKKEFDLNNYQVLNAFCDPIAIIDREGLIVKVNNAWKKFAFENGGEEDCTCEGVNYFLACKGSTGTDRDIALAAMEGIQRVIRNELEVFELEYPCDSPFEKRWFLLKATSLSVREGLCVVAHNNISRRKFAEIDVERKYEVLVSLNENLNTTVYQLAHDIQSPLNSIKGVISLNRDNIISLEHTLELIETTIKNLSRFLEETVQAALKPSLENLVEINFREMVNEVVAAVKYLNPKITITCNVKLSAPFYSYSNELRTIFSNIITNSIKYSDPSKDAQVIEVIIEGGESSACILIRDNGIGIDQKNFTRVFELKFKENDSTHGFGVGLHLVKHALQKLNAVFSVKSEVGKGSEFVFDIPNLTGHVKNHSLN